MGFVLGNSAVSDLLPLDQQATDLSRLHFLISQHLSPSLKIGATPGLNAETTDSVKPSSAGVQRLHERSERSKCHQKQLTTSLGSERSKDAMQLLQLILPRKIISRIQAGETLIADAHSNLVVLFSDIVDFTPLSSAMPTADMFKLLSDLFTAFDRLADRFGVYKFETIGDAYLVVAGHDEDALIHNSDGGEKVSRLGSPAKRMLDMARAMLEVVRGMALPGGGHLRIRIGIHCGPAYAGVLGHKNPRYTFVGDTVNTASRMESSGFPMCIQLSDAAHKEILKSGLPSHRFLPLGTRRIKGKGDMVVWLACEGDWQEAAADAMSWASPAEEDLVVAVSANAIHHTHVHNQIAMLEALLAAKRMELDSVNSLAPRSLQEHVE